MNKVLFVDDEVLILNSLRRGLVNEDYEKFFAVNGEEALAIMATENISVLVTDMKMPGISGLDLLKRVKTLYPDMVKIVLSGYTQLPQVLVTINQGDIYKFITKPWDLEHDFKAVVREAVDHYNFRTSKREAAVDPVILDDSLQHVIETYDHKLTTIKSEIELIKTLNKLELRKSLELLDDWNHQKEDKSVLVDRIGVLNQMMTEVLDFFPLQEVEFEPKALIDTFKKNMIHEKSLKHYEFGMDNKTPLLLNGYYDLFSFTLKVLNRVFFIESFDTHVDIIISGETINDDDVMIRVLMKTKESNYKTGILQSGVLNWFIHVLQFVGGSLVSKEFGGAHALIFAMPFKK